MQGRKKSKRLSIILFLTIVLTIILVILFYNKKLLNIIRYISYSIVLSYILTPISRKLECHLSRPRATLILFLGVLIVLILIVVFFIPILIKQGVALFERIPVFLMELQGVFIKIQDEMVRLKIPYNIQIILKDYIDKINMWLAHQLKTRVDGALNGLGKLTGIFTVPVLCYYFIKDRDYFKGIIMNIIPKKGHGAILRGVGEINKILNRFIRGQILVALIVGSLTTIGYIIIGLPYAIIMGLFMGIFEIIPYLGPVLGAVPPALVAILHSPTKLVATIMVIILVQQLESNIFTPKIMGKHVGLHPVYIILGLWAAGSLFGVIGMFFAVPGILILRVVLKGLYLSIVSDKENMN